MKIGELSRRTGVSVRMLRYYESEDLLAPKRTTAGYRDFSMDDVDTVQRIRTLGSAGLTLPTIRMFLPCRLEQRAAYESCDELMQMVRSQISLIDERRRKLEASRHLLEELLRSFEASRVPGRAGRVP
jgi:DNA-binding transcriptional MerR regulator